MVYKATSWKVEIDGEISFVEAQEHCDIWWRGDEGCACRLTVNPDTLECEINRYAIKQIHKGKVLDWSFDYGKTWEVNNEG